VNIRSIVTAFSLGLRDGWALPYGLNSSANIENLAGNLDTNQDWLDRGANWGQRLRAPIHHQYSPFNRKGN